MSAKPWYPWYVSNWRAKTVGLSAEQKGVYRELLDECYMRGGPLPADPGMLYRIAQAHTPSEKAAVDMVAGAFFSRRGDLLHHDRVEKEINRNRALTEFGSSGGTAKQANKVAKGVAKPLAKTIAEPIAKGLAEPLANDIALQVTNNNHIVTTTSNKPLASGLTPDAPKAEALTAKTWQFYSVAYQSRYGVPPARNATVNGQMASFLKRVGIEEAPAIAAWYVDSSEQFYVKKKHSVGALLADAEKLRTEWATRKHGTETAARMADSTDARRTVWTDLIEEFHGPQ